MPTQLYARGDRGRLLPRSDRARRSTRASISSRPAATRCGPTSASPRSARTPDGLWRRDPSAGRAAVPAQCRHHRRGADAQGAARRGRGRTGARRARRTVLGEIEEYFIEQLTPGRHLLFAGEILRFEGIARERGLCRARGRRTTAEDPVLCGRQVPAVDLSRRPGAQDARRPSSSGRRCRTQVCDWLQIQQRNAR